MSLSRRKQGRRTGAEGQEGRATEKQGRQNSYKAARLSTGDDDVTECGGMVMECIFDKLKCTTP